MTESRRTAVVPRGTTVGRTHLRAPARPGQAWFESTLRGAQADAGWAYEQLWTVYAGRVRGYLRRQGAQDPEGLTNDAFLGAFRAIREFQGDEPAFRSWLFSIVHRRLVDERRALARRPRTVDLEAAPTPATDGDLDAVLASVGDSEVERLLSGLSPLERDVLLLRLVAGLSAEEVGQVVGRRPGAVRMIQHRALAALRERLGDGT